MTKTKVKIAVVAVAVISASSAILGAVILVNQLKVTKEKKVMMEIMKTKGCVADGLLSGYGDDTDNSISLIERSQCQYLHRAIETWAAPPDFDKAGKNLKKIKKDYIYGMFLAEAISPGAKYYYLDEKRYFNFASMCQPGSAGFWGEGTCKANLNSTEYQEYLAYITRQAIDLGVRSFLFGQIYFQDNAKSKRSAVPDVVEKMRDYAASKNKVILIGAQTNDISDEKYLKNFDYIEGGVGLYEDGSIENGPCLKGLWKTGSDSCWALLWNDKYALKANNVLLHLDWSGLQYDDMSRFARMKPETRAKTLRYLYALFRSKNMGFLMPFLAVTYEENGGCYGPKPNFYSSDNKYSCKDEDIINSILAQGGLMNNARFIGESVPPQMEAGQVYPVSVTIKNTGNSVWTKEKQIRLGSQNPQDNGIWGGRVNLDDNETIAPGQEKTFSFSVTAPSQPGTYNFQWKMLQENQGWFGQMTDNMSIQVIAAEEKTSRSAVGG